MMKVILFLASYAFISDSLSKDTEFELTDIDKTIKHHFVVSVAKSIVSKELKPEGYKSYRCSPEEKNNVWYCFVSDESWRFKKPSFNSMNLSRKVWTIEINFIGSEYFIYEGYLFD